MNTQITPYELQMNSIISQDDVQIKFNSTLDGLVPFSLVYYDQSELKFVNKAITVSIVVGITVWAELGNIYT